MCWERGINCNYDLLAALRGHVQLAHICYLRLIAYCLGCGDNLSRERRDVGTTSKGDKCAASAFMPTTGIRRYPNPNPILIEKLRMAIRKMPVSTQDQLQATGTATAAFSLSGPLQATPSRKRSFNECEEEDYISHLRLYCLLTQPHHLLRYESNYFIIVLLLWQGIVLYKCT